LRKGLRREVLREIARGLAEVGPGWIVAGPSIARRTGPWVQVLDIDESRWADEFVPRFGLHYLRAWDVVPRIEPVLLASRLKAQPHRVDDWITERRFRAGVGPIIDRLREQVRPRVDQPLRAEVAERLVREGVADWNVHHALTFIAAERLDREEAERHLADLERTTAGRPLDEWVESARQIVDQIGRPDTLRAHLDAMAETKLASLKGRPLG
jgi:hypothetical protein